MKALVDGAVSKFIFGENGKFFLINNLIIKKKWRKIKKKKFVIKIKIVIKNYLISYFFY